MEENNQSLRLQFNPNRSYIPISYEDADVGLCTPEFAASIVDTINKSEKLQQENEKLTQYNKTLNKALKMACTDLVKQLGGTPQQINELFKQYVDRFKRPDHGSRAIMFLLRDRQEQLDISDKEFVRFCDSYKLSPQDLRDIYGGKEISDEQIGAIARIVGRAPKELIQIRDGFTDNEISKLARILGTSTEELSELFESQ